jgi:drug/metabolite transporter (DMT)-like permease
MTDGAWLWAVFTVIAAAAQTVRNAAQRELTTTLGTVGATHVRFLFGLPFSVVFLLGIMLITERSLPSAPASFWLWAALGAAMQFAATAWMLVAMGERSFVVAIAYIKTEPIQVALFGLVLLGDHLTLPLTVAILIATSGVLLMSFRPGAFTAGGGIGSLRPVLVGLASGGMFGLSAIGFRGAILSLGNTDSAHFDFVMAATFTLVVGLTIQCVALTPYLWWRERATLRAIAAAWRPSLFAGFMGALASQFWYLAFALATAASVRTLALIEVLFAQAISKFVFRQATTVREVYGIVLIVAGVALLLWAH